MNEQNTELGFVLPEELDDRLHQGLKAMLKALFDVLEVLYPDAEDIDQKEAIALLTTYTLGKVNTAIEELINEMD